MPDHIKYLKHRSATGRETVTELRCTQTNSVYYLPNQVGNNIDLLTGIAETDPGIRLDVDKKFALLSMWPETPHHLYILCTNGEKLNLPLSTIKHQKSIILSDRSQFGTTNGIWTLEFEFQSQTVSGSSRLPELPCYDTGSQVSDHSIKEGDTSCSVPQFKREAPQMSWCSKSQSMRSNHAGTFQKSSHHPGSSISGNVNVITNTEESLFGHDLIAETGVQPRLEYVDSVVNVRTKLPGKDTDHIQNSTVLLEPSNVQPVIDTTKKRKSPRKPYSHRKRTLLDSHLDEMPQVVVRKKEDEKDEIDEGSSSSKGIEAFSNDQQDQLHLIELDQSQNQPQFSSRSLRSRSKVPSASTTVSTDKALVAVNFSSKCTVQGQKRAMTAFHNRGGRIVTSVNEADVFCVLKGRLQRTCKLVMAVVLGKPIVTEDWMLECNRQGTWLDVSGFLPKDTQAEQEWEFQLREAINEGTGAGVRTGLLQGISVYLAPQLNRELSEQVTELCEVAKAMGAHEFQTRIPTKKESEQRSILVLGCAGDAHTKAVGKGEIQVYAKEVLTKSALRGRLDLSSDEFKVAMHTEAE